MQEASRQSGLRIGEWGWGVSRQQRARELLIVAARYLLTESGSEPYAGPFEVHLQTRRRALSEKLPWETRVPELPTPTEQSTVALFSEEESAIISVLEDGPAKGLVVAQKSGVEKSRCQVILAQLKSRGVVRNDSEDGYCLVETPG